MGNEELLKQIQSFVLDSEKRLTKKIDIVESKLEGKIDAVETKLERKIDAVKTKLERKIDTVDMKIEIVNKRIDQSIEENADFFQEMGVVLDQIKNELLKKIKAIEKFVGLPTASKN